VGLTLPEKKIKGKIKQQSCNISVTLKKYKA